MGKLAVFGSGVAAGLLFFVGAATSLAGGSFFIDDATSFVGIGNTTPQSRLDVSGAMYSRLVTASSTSIDWNQGNVQTMTLSSSPTLTFSNGQAGGEYSLILKQDATGGRTVTWPASVKWENETEPVLSSAANSTDAFNFIYDGTDYLGSAHSNYGTPQITFDASGGSSDNSGTVSSLTFSHTVSGSNPTLVVVVSVTESNADTVGITGVTYDGISMTQDASDSENTGICQVREKIYHLINPPAGTHNVVASVSGNVTTCNKQIAAVSMSYDGTNQSSQPDSTGTVNNPNSANSSISASDTVSGSGVWLVGGATDDIGAMQSTNTPGANTTYRGSAQLNLQAADSNAKYSAGTHSLNWSRGASPSNGDLVGVVIGLNPF